MSKSRRPCGVCPIWKDGWCSHLAEMRPPKAPACDFGLKEINKEYYRNYSANRRKQAKGEMSNSRPIPAGEIGQFGNAAKIRAAMSALMPVAEHGLNARTFSLNCSVGATNIEAARALVEQAKEAIADARAALAAPARNCDRFGGDPKRLHDEWWAWSGKRENCNEDGTVKLTYGEWLLARGEDGRGDGSPRAKEGISGNGAGEEKETR